MTRTDSGEIAADLAAEAALLEIAEELGLSDLLDGAEPFTLEQAAGLAAVPAAGAASYLRALVSAGLVEQASEDEPYTPVADLADRRHRAGYLSWALNANRPYIDNAAQFLRDPEAAGARYCRDGRRVAVSSRWIGSHGFYPGVVAEITHRTPHRLVDLGAGAGGLLIRLLGELPGSTGLALDLSGAACEEARRAARRAGMADRLDVVHRSIESIADDPSPVRGADVVHAGFVLHDVVGRPGVLDAVLRACRKSMAEGGRVVVTDAVPYVPNQRERAFSSLFSYLHASSMNVNLPSAEVWHEAFRRAGFEDVTSTPLPMPGSRMFTAAG
ncbi:class I SAM-dependent methyltransferase [Streptomyces javensis]|uniref:class I SAM-dependent methyltransferase n=1 Tax=Streptomyces javensis TaxID=114698 RepID=UPI0034067010